MKRQTSLEMCISFAHIDGQDLHELERAIIIIIIIIIITIIIIIITITITIRICM